MRKLYRVMAVGFFAAALASCGGGGGADTTTVATPETPAVDDKGGETNISAALPMETWLAEGVAFRDRDGDGIEDHLDSRPDDPPLLADPFANQSLTVLRAWTEVDGEKLTSTSIEGKLLHLEVAGLPATGGHDQWVVFLTNEGLRAVPASVESAGKLTVQPVAEASGLHVVSGSLRGQDRPLHGLSMSEAVLYDARAVFGTGTEARLAGRNLALVEKAFLGPDELTIASRTADELAVVLPVAPRSNRLVIAREGDAIVHSRALDIRHDVELSVGLDLLDGEELRFRFNGGEHRISASQPKILSVPAWKPVVLTFDIVSGTRTRSYGNLRAVIWPGDTQAAVTAQSSLVGRMLGISHLLTGFGGNDWAARRAAAELANSTQAAADYATALRAHAADGAPPVPEASINAAVKAYDDLAAANAATATAMSLKSIGRPGKTALGCNWAIALIGAPGAAWNFCTVAATSLKSG